MKGEKAQKQKWEQVLKLALATCLVPTFFWHEPMKNFLYERLGKDYVVSRLGNSGREFLIGLGGFTIALVGLQSFGLYQNSILYESAQNTVDTTLEKTLTQLNNDRDNAVSN